MVNYVWVIFVSGIAFCLGIFVVTLTWIQVDKRHEKELLNNAANMIDDWCCHNCKRYEECNNKYKDPDDVWKALDEYCSRCMVAEMADELWEKERKKKK